MFVKNSEKKDAGRGKDERDHGNAYLFIIHVTYKFSTLHILPISEFFRIKRLKFALCKIIKTHHVWSLRVSDLYTSYEAVLISTIINDKLFYVVLCIHKVLL